MQKVKINRKTKEEIRENFNNLEGTPVPWYKKLLNRLKEKIYGKPIK